MKKKGTTKAAGVWTKFRLLMWKNFLQQWRHPVQTFMELLLPVATMALILLLRNEIEPVEMNVVRFPPVPAHTLNNSLIVLRGMNITNMTIAYSPRSVVLEDVIETAVTDIIMQNAIDLIRFIIEADRPLLPEIFPNITIPPELPDWLETLNTTLIHDIVRSLIQLRVQPYESSADLRGIYAEEQMTRIVVAAVEFDDSLHGATELPSNISYALRFPQRPRLNSFFGTGGRSWRSDVLFPAFEVPGPRSPSSAHGGSDPGYVSEMFIAFQHAISKQLVSRITEESLDTFDVHLQRFPHPAYLQDLAVEALQYLFPMFMMLSFSYTAVNIVRAVTVEKELQLKETLKIMGMPTWIHWTAWFCKQFLYLLVAAIFITVLLKVNWFTNEDGFSDYAVLTNTPWTVLFFYLLLYLACTIFFCFMVSGFFSNASTAALFTGVAWYLTYIPAFMLSFDVSMSVPVQVITCFSINSAMSYGFQLMIASESTGGMQWGAFMSAPTTDTSRLLFGHVIIMLVVDCVVYMLIALYLEQVLPGPYGTPKPWYFLFHKDFWCSKKSADAIIVNEPDSPKVTKEKDPQDLAVGVRMTDLTKVFGNNVAVNNLSLNIYDDQITVLLGHNGAGKSTTISMLTGNLEVTSGSVWVAGYDMSWYSSEARAHIGLCPQHNVLFNELTVREHLEFFARLKGYRGKQLYAEIDTLIEKLELQDKRDYQSKGLSGGQKRRLCVGVALCGDARVVLLDEPTSGMDPSSRRALWDLLLKEKKGRSMILTTHFMDEADILGDRIAIMASGRLQCVGSPYFLKRHYGLGYTLVVVKNKDFQIEACTQILNKYIPGITVKEDRGREVTYSLTHEQSHVFETMLSDLENNVGTVNYKNYGLTATTLEDVFMSVGSDVATGHLEPDDADTVTGSSSDTPYNSDFDASSIDPLDVEKPIRGVALLVQHAVAVWLKLGLVWLRSWPLLLLQVLVPVLIVNATLGLLEYVTRLSPTIQRRPLTLDVGYSETETLLNFEGGNSTSLGALAVAAYEDLINSSGIPTMIASVVEEPIDEYYLRRTSDTMTMAQMRHRWLTGASFGEESATAWFSNFAYHDVAAALAGVHSALLRARVPGAELRVYNHPLEVQYMDQTDTQAMLLLLAMQIASGIGTSLGIASAVYVMFYIKERAIRAKLLQKAAGIQPVVLWSSAAIFDWLWFLVISATIVISCLIFSVIGLSSSAELGRLYLMLMIYGAAMLPLNYLVSHFFEGPATGFVVIFFVNVIFGNVGTQIVQALWTSTVGSTAEIADILDNILQFFPLYSLIIAVRGLNEIGMTRYTCLQGCDFLSSVVNVEQCNMTFMCTHMPNCCVPEDPYFNWEEPGILRYIVMMLVSCVLLWAVLMSIEYNIWNRIFSREKKPPSVDESTVDADVRDEERHVQSAEGALLGHGLTARALTKYYGKHLAVNQVSFSVSDSECFGLLGVNGAGKTTTFKMLMGDETISSGDAYVSGYSVKKNITKVHENIGYCPQFDAMFGELTGRETLRLFSLLRGLSAAHSAARTAALADALGFTKHLDKRVHQYSGGNKRKLSTAVALLGRTRLVFVDEPTTGVDPAAKRQVWRAIRGATRVGRGVVLTSHSMEECEALCSRLTIMVNGQLHCLGPLQHLKTKFSQGYTLIVKCKLGPQRDEDVARINQFICAKFAGAKLIETYLGISTYYLADAGLPWWTVFHVMEEARAQLPIEDYSVSQTTLEQVFLRFTRLQGTTESEEV